MKALRNKPTLISQASSQSVSVHSERVLKAVTKAVTNVNKPAQISRCADRKPSTSFDFVGIAG